MQSQNVQTLHGPHILTLHIWSNSNASWSHFTSRIIHHLLSIQGVRIEVVSSTCVRQPSMVWRWGGEGQ